MVGDDPARLSTSAVTPDAHRPPRRGAGPHMLSRPAAPAGGKFPAASCPRPARQGVRWPSGRARSRIGIPVLSLMVIVDEISSGDAGTTAAGRLVGGWGRAVRAQVAPGSLTAFRLSRETSALRNGSRGGFDRVRPVPGAEGASCLQRTSIQVLTTIPPTPSRLEGNGLEEGGKQAGPVKRQRPCPGGQGLEPFAATSSGAEAE